MKIAQSVKLGAWLLLVLNLMMSFGSIWVFTRMAPAIEIIIVQNERSLHACEKMLSSLVLAGAADETDFDAHSLRSEFENALNHARSNITEKEEPAAIALISNYYLQAFEGSVMAIERTVQGIQKLSKINRGAMVSADHKARKFGYAGAWGIVFMSSVVFLVGLLFMRGLRINIINPLQELHEVISAVKSGDSLRRCTGPDAPQDIRSIFRDLNDILDRYSSWLLRQKE
jgi:methyl-accepting chemotaxis protein